jgi:RHS repeat-associated protein
VQNFHFDFSTIGNLAYRADANAGVGERLTAAGAYDAQNRLTSVQRIAHTADHTSGAVQATTSFTYNALGNLLTKGGITGTYNYAATPQTSCPAGYTTTPGPHAVRRTGSSSTNYRHYCYDRNGNQTQGWNYVLNRQRTQTWTSYNLPASITENGTSIAFSYGADRQRFRQVNGFTGTTTIYVEGLFDREVTGALVNDVHYILANGQAVATFSSRSDAVTSTRYLHRDHVGSVTHVTNETGTLVDSFAYDAWGARRNPSNWQDYAGQPPAPLLRQPQFTGHEGLHDVGIVHMNGRIYDPKLGRVLSADPFVQFAGDGQSYNRYSYALNNPLAYTDPSGFLAERVCFLSGCGAAGSARVGAIGSGSSRPAIGVTRTMWFGGGWSGGFSVPLYNSGWGAGTTCPSGMLCQSGESGSRASTPDLTIWMSTPGSTVTYTPYAGLIADDTGESSGGALASSTIAGYEQRVITVSAYTPSIWEDLYYSDFYLVSRSMRLFEAANSSIVELFTGEQRGWLTGREPTPELSNTVTTASVVTAPFGLLPKVGGTIALTSSKDIIQYVAGGEAAKGIQHLQRFLSRAERGLLTNAKTRAMAIGTAVHRATDSALGELFPGRFEYYANRGMDFVDKTTGELVELTTRAQQAYKQWKYGVSAESVATC